VSAFPSPRFACSFLLEAGAVGPATPGKEQVLVRVEELDGRGLGYGVGAGEDDADGGYAGPRKLAILVYIKGCLPQRIGVTARLPPPHAIFARSAREAEVAAHRAIGMEGLEGRVVKQVLSGITIDPMPDNLPDTHDRRGVVGVC